VDAEHPVAYVAGHRVECVGDVVEDVLAAPQPGPVTRQWLEDRLVRIPVVTEAEFGRLILALAIT
jgi:hypothetical protein